MTYHNSGHHRDVGTPNDLTSAKKGDVFYWFAIKSQIGGYFKTWRLEVKKLKAQGKVFAQSYDTLHPITVVVYRNDICILRI